MNKNALLSYLVLCYLVLTYYVYSNYNSNSSVSNIVCNSTCKYNILFFMFLMGIGTVLYELQRNDLYSIICICIILFGIFGLVCVNETNTLHYMFASFVFIAILGFMARYCYLTNNKILISSFVFEIILFVFVLQNINESIFWWEIAYIMNFACYYLYLHFT
jgi:hypothetical protein